MLGTPTACTYVAIVPPPLRLGIPGACRMRAGRWLRYKCAGRFRRQTCEDCYHDGRSAVWFHVPDDLWDTVRGTRHVLCLTCFDRRAERLGVDYSGDVTIQGRSSWLACGVAMQALERRQAEARTSDSFARIVRSA
jgi:hypothetical protein